MSACSDLKSIGKRIKELRERRGLTQEELSKKLSIQREKLAKMETGRQDFKTQDIISVADYFDVSCDYILRGVSSDYLDIYKHTKLTEKEIAVLKGVTHRFEMTATLTNEKSIFPVGEWIIESVLPEMEFDLSRILFYLNFNLLLNPNSPIGINEYIYGAVCKISDKCKYKVDKFMQEYVKQLGYSDYKSVTDVSADEIFDFSKMEYDTNRQSFIVCDKKKAGD